MRRMQKELAWAFAAEYRRRGMPAGAAGYHGTRMAQIVVSRMESGAPEEYWAVGMDGWFKNIVKAVTKPFRQVFKEAKRFGKKVEKAVVRPIAKEIRRIPKNIERHVIRPIAHWKYLSYVANIIPGYGQVLSLAISAAQAARSIHVARADQKKAIREFELHAAIAYRQYQKQASEVNVMPMSFAEFKDALVTQSSF